MAKQLLGKPVADAVREDLLKKVETRKSEGKGIGFATLRVGDDIASKVYQESLFKAATKIGLEPREFYFSEESTEEEIIQCLEKIENDATVAGVLVFMPLPKKFDSDRIARAIPREKDVDCLNPLNFSEVMIGKSEWGPCTARAVMELLDFYQYELSGKNVTVIGRSNVVGRPLAQMLLRRNATVTTCHSRTKDLSFHTKHADLVVLATGQRGLLNGEMVDSNTWIVDVGINMKEDGTGITGDADFESCSQVCEAISPVPGGVGSISVTMVLQAILKNENSK